MLKTISAAVLAISTVFISSPAFAVLGPIVPDNVPLARLEGAIEIEIGMRINIPAGAGQVDFQHGVNLTETAGTPDQKSPYSCSITMNTTDAGGIRYLNGNRHRRRVFRADSVSSICRSRSEVILVGTNRQENIASFNCANVLSSGGLPSHGPTVGDLKRAFGYNLNVRYVVPRTPLRIGLVEVEPACPFRNQMIPIAPAHPPRDAHNSRASTSSRAKEGAPTGEGTVPATAE